jgi:two-component system nitrate/nitrite response regulator NarL
MGSGSQHAIRLEAEAAAAAPFDRPRRAPPGPTPSAAAAFAVALPTRNEARVAVLTADSLLAFAVTTLATAHFPAVTVIRPELDDIRAARHLDSRTHALIIVDAALQGELGPEALGAWLRPFRAIPMLLISSTPGAHTLEGCANVTSAPRDITARGLAEMLRQLLRRSDNGGGERRQRPQDNDRLTATHWRVIGYLGGGHSNKEIAYRMGISEATVKAHVGAAIARLGLTNRTEVALFAQRLAMGSRWSAAAADVSAPV